MKHLRLICFSLVTLLTACSGVLNSNSPESVTVKPISTTASSSNNTSANVAEVQFGIHSADKSCPKTQNSPPEYFDSLDWLAACRTVGYSIAHTEGHNLNWFVSRAQADSGRAYYVKGEDTRCWAGLVNKFH